MIKVWETMGIKKGSRQTQEFQNEWHKLRVNLLQSAAWLNGELRHFLEPYGMTQKQFNILRILRGQEPDTIGLTIQDIRDLMIDKMSDTSRLVERLARKNYVQKRPCSQDKRHARVRITAEGLRLLDRIDDDMARLDAITGLLNIEEARQLNALLDKMRGHS